MPLIAKPRRACTVSSEDWYELLQEPSRRAIMHRRAGFNPPRFFPARRFGFILPELRRTAYCSRRFFLVSSGKEKLRGPPKPRPDVFKNRKETRSYTKAQQES